MNISLIDKLRLVYIIISAKMDPNLESKSKNIMIQRVTIIPNRFNSYTFDLTFLSFSLLWEIFTIRKLDKCSRFLIISSIESSVNKLYDILMFVVYGKSGRICFNPKTVSLFLANFKHFICFSAAAKLTKYIISLSASSQPVISSVSVEFLN